MNRIAVVLAIIASPLAVAASSGAQSSGSPPRVAEVPARLTGAGVNVNGQVTLRPLLLKGWSPALMGFLPESQALKIARRDHGRAGRARALLASLTVPGSLPPKGSHIRWATVENVPAWIVTFTLPRPVNVALGFCSKRCPKLLVRHANFALDAVNGRFVVGFWTK